jgi:undecaprenyl-diphosphatase
MTLFHAIVLGAVQGLTEFLPISSDGHLTLVRHVLSLPAEGRDALGFEVMLHFGSLIALLVCCRTRWMQIVRDLLSGTSTAWALPIALIIGTIPAAFTGILFEDAIASSFRSIMALAVLFLCSGLVLILGEYAAPSKTRGIREIGVIRAFLIGCWQALALLPALSRSGSTITGGRLAGLSREDAVEFSFLLAIPALAGAVTLTVTHMITGSVVLPPLPITLSGFIASLITSMIAVSALRIVYTRTGVWMFASYLALLAAILVTVS